MSQKNDNDEASFEGLMSFSTAPPPPGDVHNARTVMADLPDDVLASLKAGQKVDGLLEQLGRPGEAMMTRRARPFELEKAISNAAMRGSAPDAAGPPLPPEQAAALSFSAEPPAFPPSIDIATSVPSPEPAVSVTESPTADENLVDPTTTAPLTRPRRSLLRVGGLVLVCVAAAIAAAISTPFLKQRLHLD